MPISYLGLSGAMLNFAGGVFLIYDSLRSRRKNLAAFGAQAFARDQQTSERERKKPLYETPDGKPLANELQWTLWLGDRSRQWTWVGFLLISAGFALAILSRILSPG